MTLSNGWPPFYPERPSSAAVEPSQLYLGYAAVALFIGLLLILPGVRGKERIYFLVRWSTSLFVGVSIIACVQGISWHEASVTAMMPYSATTNQTVSFKVGLMIGLQNYNITLIGSPDDGFENTLKFSEKFTFLESDEALDHGLRIGLPFPILNVLENFSVNRISSIWLWGRRYWVAGHYGVYMLWSAFAAWIITNVLFHTVLRYAGLLLAFTGLLMLGANFSFISIESHGCRLQIHLGYYEAAVLRMQFGWCFWLCLVVGIVCVVCGCVIFISDHVCPKGLGRFFNLKKDDDCDLFELEVDDCMSRSSGSYRSLSKHSEMDSKHGHANYGFHSTDDDVTPEMKRKTSRQRGNASNTRSENYASVIEAGTDADTSTPNSPISPGRESQETAEFNYLPPPDTNRHSRVSFKMGSLHDRPDLTRQTSSTEPPYDHDTCL